ncbi:MAG: pilus assembly protein [Achromobacter sp.]|uniref:TadE/TadG family type IV pilus assembly protein n=1 Tax=Achromobacter sp. TaxID=134375 RepID=UPI003D08BCA6
MTAFFFAPRQRGTAAIEFAVAGAMVLLLGLLGVEAARWQAVRHMAHVALMEAARAGATAHGDPIPMRDAFLQGLLPLHASAQGEAGAWRQLTRVHAERVASTGLTPWRIEVLRPDARAFREHGRAGLNVPAAPGRRAIDNDYQDLQHARRPSRPDGLTIFEANTLALRLTYLYKPWLAPVRAVLATLGRNDASYAGVARQHGMLPIQIELEIEMHSHPVDWTGSGRYPAEIVVGACRNARCH